MALKEQIERQPRYSLSEEDSKFFCFVTHRNKRRSYAIDFLNISSTGLVFTIEEELAPQLDEYIKMEFLLPGFGQLACVGRIVRLESPSKRTLLEPTKMVPLIAVAVTFEKLNQAQRKALVAGLGKKIRDQKYLYYRKSLGSIGAWIMVHLPMVLVILVSLILVTAIFLFLLSPAENYLPNLPIPWGTRY